MTKRQLKEMVERIIVLTKQLLENDDNINWTEFQQKIAAGENLVFLPIRQDESALLFRRHDLKCYFELWLDTTAQKIGDDWKQRVINSENCLVLVRYSDDFDDLLLKAEKWL